jgi:hypothetical protein
MLWALKIFCPWQLEVFSKPTLCISPCISGTKINKGGSPFKRRDQTDVGLAASLRNLGAF